MKKLVSGLLAFAVMVLMVTTVSAKDLDGRFGLGYSQNLGGVSGLNVVYYVGDIRIDGTLGFDFVKPDQGDSKISAAFAIGGVYNLMKFDSANFGVGLKGDIGFKNKAATSQDSIFDFNVEIPFLFEYFFSDNFAINLATGLLVVIVPEKVNALPSESATDVKATNGKDIGFHLGPGGLFGQAGFVLYF